MTTRRIQADELLSLASALAYEAAGAGRPRTIYLRRSVSSSYYALFHELCEQAATALLGSASSPSQPSVKRWVSHADVRALCEAMTGNGRAAVRLAVSTPDADLVRIADAVVTLQDQRHLADYDDSFDLDKAGALSALQLSRDAVSRSRSLLADAEPTYAVFLRLMTGAVKVARNR